LYFEVERLWVLCGGCVCFGVCVVVFGFVEGGGGCVFQ
jgi:hypothetical protein